MSDMHGFNLDEETIETFDSILLALTQDPELKEEFTKLKFIQILKDKYDSSEGPMKQIVMKLSQIEQDHKRMIDEHTKMQMDLKRAVADMTHATKAIRQAGLSKDEQVQRDALKALEGIEFRTSSYTWNQK